MIRSIKIIMKDLKKIKISSCTIKKLKSKINTIRIKLHQIIYKDLLNKKSKMMKINFFNKRAQTSFLKIIKIINQLVSLNSSLKKRLITNKMMIVIVLIDLVRIKSMKMLIKNIKIKDKAKFPTIKKILKKLMSP